MTAIVSIDPEAMEFEPAHDQEPHRIRLVLTDTDDQQHRLTLEGRAISDLALIFRAIQERFPGVLGGH